MTPTIDLFEPQRVRLRRWTAAALFVVAAHIGCTAAALWHWPDDEADDSAASPVIVEMLPALAAKPIDSPDVAHGPLMEEAMLTPQAAKEVKREVEKEMPTVEPSPAPEPEVVLPKPQPVTEKTPEEVKPEETKQTQKAAEQAVAAPLTMAPPRVDATEQPVAAAPSPGSAAAAARAKAAWEKSIVTHLNRFKRYPEAARAHGNQGDVAVQFTLDRGGGVIGSRIVRSSGSSALDEEALAVLRRANPLPAPPEHVNGTTFDLTLPIQFRIR
jgi:periplasmic protein TonB